MVPIINNLSFFHQFIWNYLNKLTKRNFLQTCKFYSKFRECLFIEKKHIYSRNIVFAGASLSIQCYDPMYNCPGLSSFSKDDITNDDDINMSYNYDDNMCYHDVFMIGSNSILKLEKDSGAYNLSINGSNNKIYLQEMVLCKNMVIIGNNLTIYFTTPFTIYQDITIIDNSNTIRLNPDNYQKYISH